MGWVRVGVGSEGHEITLRQGDLEGWKESVSHSKSLASLKRLDRYKKYLSFKLKNVFMKGSMVVFF